MAWTPPTVADFKTRFPSFGTIADATIQMVLDEAVDEVGERWIEKYRTPGVLYLTAHLLVSQGVGVLSAGDGGAAVTGAIKRRTVGDVTTEFAGIGSGGGSGDLSRYSTTAYGVEYRRLLRKNIPAVAWV